MGAQVSRMEKLLSQQRLLAAALARSEAQYRSTFEQAPVGIAHSSTDGRFSRVNRKFCELLGYSELELLERSSLEVTHPDDVGEAKIRMAKVVAGNAAAVLHGAEKRYVKKD